MSEGKIDFHIENSEQGPNIILNFEMAVDTVMQVEAMWSNEVGVKEKSILKSQMGEALEYLMEQKALITESEKEKFKKKVVTGFQGIGGFNRYIVRGDGSLGLTQSHSINACIKKAKELGIETPEYGF